MAVEVKRTMTASKDAPRSKCDNPMPASAGSGPWREWHRGHECDLDPDAQPAVRRETRMCTVLVIRSGREFPEHDVQGAYAWAATDIYADRDRPSRERFNRRHDERKGPPGPMYWQYHDSVSVRLARWLRWRDERLLEAQGG